MSFTAKRGLDLHCTTIMMTEAIIRHYSSKVLKVFSTSLENGKQKLSS